MHNLSFNMAQKKQYWPVSFLLNVSKRWNKFFYQNPKGTIDPDLQWKQQNEQHKKNKVYKMVNFTGGGTFIDEYDKGGTEEDKKKLVQEYFEKDIAPNFLHKEVKILNENDYQSWLKNQNYRAKKFMQEKENQGHFQLQSSDFHSQPKDADAFSVVTLDSVVSPFQPHEVKWRLDQRGAIGETPLHLLFLNGGSKHIKIAEALLEKYPDLAVDVYEGYEYYGESCLHFAIIQNNLEAVNILLKTGKVNVHGEAKGKFFIPVDIKRGDVKLRKKKFEGYAYYGEYPLSFAASVGNHKIYDRLVESGCDPNKKDRYGNNVLHLTVIHDQPDMYYHAVRHPEKPANPDLCNTDKLTPLALAAKLGKTDMLQKILEISSRHYWSYNTVTCSAYPLKSLDSIKSNGETDWNSALMMIIRGKKDAHLDMLSNHVIHQLLNEKWKQFGQKKFFRLFAAFLCHVIILTFAIYLRPFVLSDLRYGQSATDIVRYVFEILVVIICCFVLYFALQEMYLESLSGYWQNIISNPSRLIYVLSVCILLVCVPIRFAELYNVEIWLLVFAVPGLWMYMLFFLRNFSSTGPYVSMISRIVKIDLKKFLVIYIIILFTCAVAFFYQFKGQEVFAFLTELGTFMTLFQMSFGEFDTDSILQGKYQALVIVMFIFFMAIVHILLLNMFIAMITRTYEKIIKQADKFWRRQWASMLVTLERSHSKHAKIGFQGSYTMNIESNRVTSEGDAEHRAVFDDNRALMVVYNQERSESQRKKDVQEKLLKISKQLIKHGSAPPQSPTFRIKSLAGLADFIRDAPRLDEENDDSFNDKASVHTLNYSDDESENEQ